MLNVPLAQFAPLSYCLKSLSDAAWIRWGVVVEFCFPSLVQTEIKCFTPEDRLYYWLR